MTSTSRKNPAPSIAPAKRTTSAEKPVAAKSAGQFAGAWSDQRRELGFD
jgi:hypothetical protein